MSIEIRLLDAGDAAVLERVAPDVFDDPIDPAASRAFLADPRHHIAVAIDADLVVGFASAVLCEHPDKPRPELWINEVGVTPAHQRRGLGRLLLQALLDRARELGARDAWVLTSRGNQAAMALYAAAGGAPDEDDTVMFTFPLTREE